jgi:transposase
MGQNFLAADREQPFLLPPDVRDWLPEGHFAWFVIEAVAQMDLEAFYAAYRRDGHGRAAFEPAVMVGLLLYAYARGIRSSRVIERACEEDVQPRRAHRSRRSTGRLLLPVEAVASAELSQTLARGRATGARAAA